MSIPEAKVDATERWPEDPSQPLWRIANWLMALASVLALVVGGLPWATVHFTPFYAHMGFGTALVGDPTLQAGMRLAQEAFFPIGSVGSPDAVVAALGLGSELYLALGGLLTIPLLAYLWLRPRIILLSLYTLWLATGLARAVICAALLATNAIGVFGLAGEITPISIASVSPALGFWLAWPAVAIGAVGLACAWRSLPRRKAA